MGGYSFEEGCELKKCTCELEEQQISVWGEYYNRIIQMGESKLKEATFRLEQLLAKEQTAQLKIIENTRTSQMKSDKETQKKLTGELDEHEMLPCDEQFKRIFEMTSYLIGREVESKLKEPSLKTEENVKAAEKKSYEEIQKVIDSKIMESTSKLEQLMTEERTARLQAEENAEIAQKNSDDKIQQLQEKLAEELSGRMKIEENAKAAQKKSEEEIKKIEFKLKDTSLKLEQVLAKDQTAEKMVKKEIQKVIDLKLMEATSELEQLLTEERTGRMKAQGNAEISQKNSENEIHKMKLLVESNFKETTLKLQLLLAEDRTARLKSEKNVKAAKKKSEEEVQKLNLIVSNLKDLKIKFQKVWEEKLAARVKREEILENFRVAQEKSYQEMHKLRLERLLTEEDSEIEISVDQSCIFSTLTLSEKIKVLNACLEAENWLREKNSLPKHAHRRRKAQRKSRGKKPKPAPSK